MLIVNADDLGYSPHRDAGIFECFSKNCLSSASLMVNGPTAESAARQAAKVGLFLGLHLNLTEGVPLADVPQLTRPNGLMYYKDDFIALRADRLCPESVIQEARAQIIKFKQLTGAFPVHVDGHQHVHVLRGMAELLAPLFQEYGVLSTRVPDEDISTYSWMSHARRQKYESLFPMMVNARIIYKKHGINAPCSFIGLGLGGLQLTPEHFKRCRELSFGTTELMVHPGHLSLDIKKTFCDPFDISPDRLYECQSLPLLLRSETLCDWRILQ